MAGCKTCTQQVQALHFLPCPNCERHSLRQPASFCTSPYPQQLGYSASGFGCLYIFRLQLLRLPVADSLAEEGQLLLQCVEGLAEAHGAFAQLFDLCEALDDAPRLHEHMQRSLASSQAQQQHSCAEYVFGRLVAEGRCNRLLSLPDSFAQPLSAWLAAQVQPQLSLSLSRNACEQHVLLNLAPSLPRSVLSATASAAICRMQLVQLQPASKQHHGS